MSSQNRSSKKTGIDSNEIEGSSSTDGANFAINRNSIERQSTFDGNDF